MTSKEDTENERENSVNESSPSPLRLCVSILLIDLLLEEYMVRKRERRLGARQSDIDLFCGLIFIARTQTIASRSTIRRLVAEILRIARR